MVSAKGELLFESPTAILTPILALQPWDLRMWRQAERSDCGGFDLIRYLRVHLAECGKLR